MSTNLRLGTDLADALREAAKARGRSQQDIVRDALAKELGLAPAASSMQRAVSAGLVEAPEPFEDIAPTLTLSRGRTSLELLDREDR